MPLKKLLKDIVYQLNSNPYGPTLYSRALVLVLGAFQSRYSEILGSGYEKIPPRFDQQYCGAIGFYDKLHTNWLHENANSIRFISTNFGTKTNSKFEMGRLPAITFYQLLGNSEQCKFSDWL